MTTDASAFDPGLDGAGDGPAGGFLGELRRVGREAFSATGLPHRRLEEWRLTPLSAITDVPFTPAGADLATLPEGLTVAGAHRLVFINGRFAADLSEVGELPPGVTVSRLDEASADALAAAERHLSTAWVERTPFAALNGALAADGALVHLAPDATCPRPIQLVAVTTAAAEPTVAYPRVLVVAEAGSRAVVVENHVGLGTTLACPVTEIVVGDGAEVEHVLVEEGGADGRIVASLGARLGQASRFTLHTVTVEGALVRNNVAVSLTGENGIATLNGLCVATASQHLENHLRVEHRVPHCESHQLYRGVLDGRARVAFTGRIVVVEDAQKTDANQANHSLLLSDRAVVNSNPQLEIFADDVKCTHGSTVGELDEDALFYLRSRGIGRAEAEGILTFGFASDLVERIPVPALAERLEGLLVDRLPGAAGARR